MGTIVWADELGRKDRQAVKIAGLACSFRELVPFSDEEIALLGIGALEQEYRSLTRSRKHA